MVSPPDLDTTDLRALRRSLVALQVFLKAVMAISAFAGCVPDWIWTPLTILFGKFDAIEESLFQLDLSDETRAKIDQQRAGWNVLMRAPCADAAAPKALVLTLIGATIPDFLEDHAITFEAAEAGGLADAIAPATGSSDADRRPDPAGIAGRDRHPHQDGVVRSNRVVTKSPACAKPYAHARFAPQRRPRHATAQRPVSPGAPHAFFTAPPRLDPTRRARPPPIRETIRAAAVPALAGAAKRAGRNPFVRKTVRVRDILSRATETYRIVPDHPTSDRDTAIHALFGRAMGEAFRRDDP